VSQPQAKGCRLGCAISSALGMGAAASWRCHTWWCWWGRAWLLGSWCAGSSIGVADQDKYSRDPERAAQTSHLQVLAHVHLCCLVGSNQGRCHAQLADHLQHQSSGAGKKGAGACQALDMARLCCCARAPVSPCFMHAPSECTASQLSTVQHKTLCFHARASTCVYFCRTPGTHTGYIPAPHLPALQHSHMPSPTTAACT
jgi:hypothetical protein